MISLFVRTSECVFVYCFVLSSRRRHTRCALLSVVQTCTLPIYKTPDWSLRSDESQLLEVIDVVTLHQRNAKEQEISTTIRSSSRWAGWIGIPPDHIYRKLSDKAGQYAELVRQAKVPYVLGVFEIGRAHV